MLLIRVAAALALAQLGMAATSTTTSSTAAIPTCGLTGWDASGTNIGYYADSSSANYSSYSACNALCNANTDCESFAYDAGVACILYNQTAETNVNTDSASPWTFFDRGGSCPPSSTTSTTASSTTSSAAAATATCTGFEGYDAGSNIGYYTGSGTYSACYALCNANSACLSFGITSDSAACILYNYTVEGNDVSSPGSGNFFYDRGGVCPSSSSSSSASSSRTSSSATSSATTPVQTGAFPNVSQKFALHPLSSVSIRSPLFVLLPLTKHLSARPISSPTTSTPTPLPTCPATRAILLLHACQTTTAPAPTATCV